jgi:hypothetical protein
VKDRRDRAAGDRLPDQRQALADVLPDIREACPSSPSRRSWSTGWRSSGRKPAFDTIVASGPNGAIRTTRRPGGRCAAATWDDDFGARYVATTRHDPHARRRRK